MPRRQAKDDVETGEAGLVWTELRKGVPSCVVVSFPSRPQRIISVAVSKAELAQQLLELCRTHSSFNTEDLKRLCRDHKRTLAKSAPGEYSRQNSECCENSSKTTEIDAMKSGTSKESKHKSKRGYELSKTTNIDEKKSAAGKVSKQKSRCGEERGKRTNIDIMKSATRKDSKQKNKLVEEPTKTTKIDAMRSATSIDSKKNSECGGKLSKTTGVDAPKSEPNKDSNKDVKCETELGKMIEAGATQAAQSKHSQKNSENGKELSKATKVYASSLHDKPHEVDESSLREGRKMAKKTTQAHLERWFQRSICRPSESSQFEGSSSADLSLTQMLGEVMDMEKPRAHDQPVPDQAGECAEVPLTQMLTEIMMDMSQPLPDMSLSSENADLPTVSCSADPNVKGAMSMEKVASFGKPRRRGKKDTRKLGRLSLKGQRILCCKKATQTTLVF